MAPETRNVNEVIIEGRDFVLLMFDGFQNVYALLAFANSWRQFKVDS